LHRQLGEVIDPRKIPQYPINEIVFGAISMFVFKSGSRNNMNNFASEGNFKKNFYKCFKFNLPHMDTVKKVFEKLEISELEILKKTLVKQLIENKVFDKWRYNGKLIVAIDATGLFTFKEPHCDKCLKRTYKANKKRKKDKIVYFHNVLEAKLVTENGFSISLCTEWIENEGVEYDKQDCEQKAFVRLAKTLKQDFPRLAICLCADGLYPNNTFFEICNENKWDYIVTLPDKTLKKLWKKIHLAVPDTKKHLFEKGVIECEQAFQFINNLEHNGVVNNWLQLDEIQTNKKNKIKKYKFVYLTNIEITPDNILLISKVGRMRWKIEKQGFDQQKNHGYNICHKYCRKSYQGMKNFYQCCQIAHLFNQLVELSKNITAFKSNKITIKHIWTSFIAFMFYGEICEKFLTRKLNHRTQIHYII